MNAKETQKNEKLKKEKKNYYFQKNDITIYQEDILKVGSIKESSIDLIITSPPYNLDIEYSTHKDNSPYQEHLKFTEKWLTKCYELARDDGRMCLNIPLDTNKGGKQSVCADITNIAKKVGWNYQSTIVWNEGNISRRTAWGSWMSASAPYVIAPVEMIVILFKNQWKKDKEIKRNDITRDEFMAWTNGLWTFHGQKKKGAGGHPAAFPIELPMRCIKLFTYQGDMVLDPFVGSGSTLIAAYENNRKGIGIDIDKDYCDIAIKRLQELETKQSALIKPKSKNPKQKNS